MNEEIREYVSLLVAEAKFDSSVLSNTALFATTDSSGTAVLILYDPDTMRIYGSIDVVPESGDLSGLNVVEGVSADGQLVQAMFDAAMTLIGPIHAQRDNVSGAAARYWKELVSRQDVVKKPLPWSVPRHAVSFLNVSISLKTPAKWADAAYGKHREIVSMVSPQEKRAFETSLLSGSTKDIIRTKDVSMHAHRAGE